MPMHPKDSPTTTNSTEQQQAEWEAIHRRRRVAFGQNGSDKKDSDQPPEDVVGLALSGGGIRSALFNDGFLRALSHRGLLRYVDYLSAISGGGYIAGHLVASGVRLREAQRESRDNEPADSFHDAESFGDRRQTEQPPWEMGLEPQTQRENPDRLPGVGQYLSRTAQFWTEFAFSQVMIVAVYAGLLGLISVLLAMAWRSFDAPLFRARLGAVDIGGGELFVAFIPFFILLIPWIVCSLAFLLRSRLNRAPLKISRTLTGILLASAVISCAVFLGNSKTEVSSSSDSNVYLNHAATWLAIAAGIAQLLVFFGREKLVLSEKSDASHVQRLIQGVVTRAVVFLACFFFIHWMAREDISGYTHHRDMSLVRDEVLDWDLLFAIVEDSCATEPHSALATARRALEKGQTTFDKFRYSKIRPVSEWDRWQKTYPQPYSEANPEPIGGNRNSTDRISQAWIGERFAGLLGVGTSSTLRTLSELEKRQQQLWALESDYLQLVNEHLLQSRFFTDDLGLLLSGDKERLSPEKVREAVQKRAEGQIGWGKSRQDALAGLLQREAERRNRPGPGTTQEQQTRIRINRELLDLLYPGLLFTRTIASTPVVQAHDQAARLGWASIWAVVLAFGLIGTWRLNRRSALFQYYRRMLKQGFIDDQVDGPLRLADADVTDVGLPYPILSGALLQDEYTVDSRRYRRTPFIFTPHFVGAPGPDTERMPSSECEIPGSVAFWPRFVARLRYGDDQPQVKHPVELVDAMAISGSAVTPFMTENAYLRIIMDVCGAQLGQWMRNPATYNKAGKQQPFWGYISVFAEFVRSRRHGNHGKWDFGFIADGGFVDYLGAHELLRRRCRLIIVTDAGSNLNGEEHGPLAAMLRSASEELGVRFLDLDHNGPIDFGRLSRDDQRLVPQPYLCMRVEYADGTSGHLVYAQMSISETDPLEIRQIRHRFPSFPDEPTENQFYTEEQVSAFRRLGYHIGSRICADLQRWPNDQTWQAVTHRANDKTQQQPFLGLDPTTAPAAERPAWFPGRQPLFHPVSSRILASYRLACFEELSYSENDILAEAVWDRGAWCFPTFAPAVRRMFEPREPTSEPPDLAELQADCRRWLKAYEANADIRAAYRSAIFHDINYETLPLPEEDRRGSSTLRLFRELEEITGYPAESVLAMHLVVVAAGCHQFHRGTPRSIFQVGGRRKLIDIVASIVGPHAAPTELSPEWLHEACAELLELLRSVFHGGAREAVISLTQLMIMQVREQSTDIDPMRSVVEFRKEANEALRNDDVTRFRAAIQKAYESESDSGSETPSKKKRKKKAKLPRKG